MRINKRAGLLAATLAIGIGAAFVGSVPVQADSTLPLNNTTADGFVSGEGSCGGLDPAGSYWHFIVAPNSGAGTFLSITLSLDNGSGPTSFTFTGAQIIPNGSQTDNVFVQVPAGYEIEDIVGGSATISGTANKFNLSHTCAPGFTPLTAEKTADGTYDTNFHWTLTKTVDDDAHSGTAGTIAGDSDWTITATKVLDPNTDFKVRGFITINNDNDVAVPVTISDVLDDGTVATVDCQGATEVAADDSLVCSYLATPTDASATLNTATITSGLTGVGGAVATDDVEWSVENANGDDPVVLTDPHLGLDEATSSTIVEVINEEFPCSSVATDYTNGSYSYQVPNTAYLDGAHTDLEASATVTVNCTLPALEVSKTADGSYDKRVAWTLEKTVDIASFTGVPGQSFLDNWNIDVTRTVTNENYAVSGTVTVTNNASIPQSFFAIDQLSNGTPVTLNCPSTTVPALDSVVCTYDVAQTDGSATYNEVMVTADGNGPVQAFAPVAFEGSFTGDLLTDLTDDRLPQINIDGLDSSVSIDEPETFRCPAADSGLYVNGVYTTTFTNTANLDGATVHLVDDASVLLTCKLQKVTGGHTIGYWFNAPAGNAQTLAARATLAATYPNVLAGVDLSTSAKVKAFGNNANCSGTCKTMLQAQFIATAMSVLKDINDYGDQCVAVPTYVEADGVAQIDDLLTRIDVLFPTLTTAQRIELKTILDGINNDLPFNLC